MTRIVIVDCIGFRFNKWRVFCASGLCWARIKVFFIRLNVFEDNKIKFFKLNACCVRKSFFIPTHFKHKFVNDEELQTSKEKEF